MSDSPPPAQRVFTSVCTPQQWNYPASIEVIHPPPKSKVVVLLELSNKKNIEQLNNFREWITRLPLSGYIGVRLLSYELLRGFYVLYVDVQITEGILS